MSDSIRAGLDTLAHQVAESVAEVKPQLFYLELRAYGEGKGRRWLVTDWVPRGAPHIPLPAS